MRRRRRKERWPPPHGSFPVIVSDNNVPVGTFELHDRNQIVRIDIATREMTVLWRREESDHEH